MDLWRELMMFSDSHHVVLLGSPYIVSKGPPRGVSTAAPRKVRIIMLSDEKGINNKLQEDASCPLKELETKGL